MEQDPDKEKFFFDGDWYLEQNADVKALGMNPFVHFSKYGWKEGRSPSMHFDLKGYLADFPELLEIDMHPFNHLLFLSKNDIEYNVAFPDAAIECSHTFATLEKGKRYKRIAVMASFAPSGVIAPYLLYYLKGLKDICDAVIFIADSPILEKEALKLSTLVHYASFARHEEYDFGSYKRGIDYLRQHIGLENIDELVLCNDSCVGPVFPLQDVFLQMHSKGYDFWSLTASPEVFPHLQSYFLCFSNEVIRSDVFIDYFLRIKKETSRSKVILKYELPLSKYLANAGFTNYGSYLPYPNEEEYKARDLKHRNLTSTPCYLLDNGVPFIKLARLDPTDRNNDGTVKTQRYIGKINPDLYKILNPYFVEKMQQKELNNYKPEHILPHEKRVYLNQLRRELKIAKEKITPELYTFNESAIVHSYLDGLNGIEIGASSMNPFGLEKTGGYANIDNKANHGAFWQPGSTLPPAKVHIVASGDELPFKDNALDYVLSSHAIEHFFDPIATIQEWFRVVKKGGYVVIIVPHKDRTFDKNRAITPFEELMDRHTHVLTPSDYAYRVDATGSDTSDLPSNFLIITKGKEVPKGYAPVANAPTLIHLHLTTWDTRAFMKMCTKMKWTIVEAYDCDDKVGNGFLVILQK